MVWHRYGANIAKERSEGGTGFKPPLDLSVGQAIVLGFFQGLTEFLPVSSSGHLVLLGQLFGLKEPDLTFSVMVHFGTLIAVMIALRAEVALMLGGLRPVTKASSPDQVRLGRRLILLVVVGTIPAAVMGLLAKDFIEGLFGSVAFVGIALLFTGSLLWWAEGRADHGRSLEQMVPKDALQIGLWQIVALAPGVSRSGTTISAGLFRGFSRADAARFSFLLSLPTIAGAVVLEARGVFTAVSGGTWVPLLVGTLTATITGFLAIQGLLQLVKRHSLRVFSYYTWLVGFIVLILPHFIR
ncbi:MAG: undecaprenyl-diphosphate phosphatase [Firmicutes bacterium]|nr:undecaprenyl-diphosphate phosphatase [Bacillota bacterium]